MGEGKEPQAPGGGEAPKQDETAAPGSPVPGWVKAAGDKVVPLLVSAVVSVGFVAFAGKAVLWTRFHALQVPSDQVVRAVPQSEAVAVGASMLLIFGLFGALATLGVYLVDRAGRATPGMSRGLLVILAIEGTVAIWFAEDKSVDARIIAAEVLLLAVGATVWVTFVGDLIDRDREVPDFKGSEDQQNPPPAAFFNEDGTSGITGLGLILTAVLALTLALSAYGIAVPGLHWSHGWEWVAAVGGLGLGLVAALLWHLCCFDRKLAVEVSKETEKRNEAKARRKREDEQREREKKKADQDPVEERRERRRGRAGALWTALRCACRWDRSLVTVNVGTAAGEDAKPAGDGAKSTSGSGNPDREKPPGFTLKPRGIGVTIVLAAIAIGAPSWILHEWWIAVSLGAVAVLGVGLWRVAALSNTRFVWYGLAVFISVPLFGTVMMMARNIDDPQVQPLALIRNTDGPNESIQGLYVTETSDRVYFANVATEGCEKELEPDSGRLLWVPKDEVVAMSIGPLQSVDDAGRAALEMSYALTPAVETPAAGPFSITAGEARSLIGRPPPVSGALGVAEALGAAGGGGASASSAATGPTGAQGASGASGASGATGAAGASGASGATGVTATVPLAPSTDQRLENPGPAVRPNFGVGLRLVPEIASPGEEVALRVGIPNPNVDGFGAKPHSHVLRLNGVPVRILREETTEPARAEFVKTVSGRVLVLDKKGLYAKPSQDRDDDPDEDRDFVRVSPGSALRPFFVKLKEEPHGYIKLSKDGLSDGGFEVAKNASVEVEGSPVQLRRVLLRQAWDKDEIRFRVPANASSGVITLECGQLGGSPLLRVDQAPVARIVAQPRKGSAQVLLDGRGSSNVTGTPLIDHWTIDGRPYGTRKRIAPPLTPRFDPYRIRLEATDPDGNANTVKMLLYRLPAPMVRGKMTEGRKERFKNARTSLEQIAQEPPPSSIEVDGNSDDEGTLAQNLKRSLKRAERARKRLLAPRTPAGASVAVPVTIHAFGNSCPLFPGAKPQRVNRRVDVFILNPGDKLITPKTCKAGREEHASW